MLEALRIFAKGYIRIYNESNELHYERHNDIQPLAKEAITKLLAKRTENAPAYIEIYTASVSKGKYVIDTITVVDENTVEYGVLIPHDNPVTTIDELRLITDDEGVFSKATGLTLSKPTNQSILINWTLNII